MSDGSGQHCSLQAGDPHSAIQAAWCSDECDEICGYLHNVLNPRPVTRSSFSERQATRKRRLGLVLRRSVAVSKFFGNQLPCVDTSLVLVPFSSAQLPFAADAADKVRIVGACLRRQSGWHLRCPADLEKESAGTTSPQIAHVQRIERFPALLSIAEISFEDSRRPDREELQSSWCSRFTATQA